MFFKSNRFQRANSVPLLLNTAPSVGLFAGTVVGCPHSWTSVETLQAGDEVLTAENGPQRISDIEVSTLNVSAAKAAAGQWPLLIPEGAVLNEKALIVAPDMRLVIEADIASELFGHNCVSICAQSLIGYRGIARARTHKKLTHVTLKFDAPQTVVGQGSVFFDVAGPNGSFAFPKLSDKQARLLTRHMGKGHKKLHARTNSPAWI